MHGIYTNHEYPNLYRLQNPTPALSVEVYEHHHHQMKW